MADNRKVVRLKPKTARPVLEHSPSISREQAEKMFKNVEQLNAGRPWSELDEHDLRSAIADGRTSAEIAEFLCRPEREVIEKARELGYAPGGETVPK